LHSTKRHDLHYYGQVIKQILALMPAISISLPLHCTAFFVLHSFTVLLFTVAFWLQLQ